MQADETGILPILRRCRAEIFQPLVPKHHGHVAKVLGDGVLIELASAVEAVPCAVELLQGTGGNARIRRVSIQMRAAA